MQRSDLGMMLRQKQEAEAAVRELREKITDIVVNDPELRQDFASIDWQNLQRVAEQGRL